ISIDRDKIEVNPEVDCWVDTEIFERTYHQTKGRQDLDEGDVHSIRGAVSLYRGAFLEGYCQDWCVYERERFQNMYIVMLDKLIEQCLIQRDYEEALDWGERVLRLDPASERTHQQIMRLHHLSGNRTLALRQYERCVRALQEELEVEPSNSTLALLQRIREDTLTFGCEPGIPVETRVGPVLSDLLINLREFPAKLAALQQEFERNIRL